MKKLIDGLRHFQEHLHWERQELFERSIAGQKPHALLITCSDSRVLPETLMQADPGDLFVARNAGNMVPADAHGGEAATIEYAISTLGVTDIIVCGHYRCGAVKALLDSESESADTPVTNWLAHGANTLEMMKKEHMHLQGEARWDKAVEQNVLVQISNLSKHPSVASRLADGTLRIHAWVLRFESSEVLAYVPHRESFEPLLEMMEVQAALPTLTACHESSVARDEFTVKALPVEVVRPKWFEALRSDVPASLVVFMVALPLCLAIAKACGVPAEVGLITGIVGGILVGLLSGSPLQVSGPAAGLIVILLDVVQERGIAILGVAVFLAGLIQIAAGTLKLGQWFRAVSPAVILGMLSGIGVILVTQQFHVMVDDLPSRSPVWNFLGIPRAVVGIFDGHDGHVGHLPAALLGLLTLSVLLFWKRLPVGKLKTVPAVLVAVLLATTTASILSLSVQRVEFESLTAAVTLLDFVSLPSLLINMSVWQIALTIAFVASAETLLCAAAVDQMHSGTRTQYDRELAAQGVGNAVCGILGALPMTGVIVRSSTNVQAGGKTRLSTILHGAWILAFVLLMPAVLRMVPTAALAAILVLTGIRLIEIHAIRELWTLSRGEGIICVLTAVAVVSFDLLTGVLLGVGLSVIKLVYAFSRLRIRRRGESANVETMLVLEGSATFLRLPKLASALENTPRGAVLHININSLSYIDHTCLTLLRNWKQQHEATGGRLILDWDKLHVRFDAARPRPRQGRLPECNSCRTASA